jgi:phage terminase small subunit
MAVTKKSRPRSKLTEKQEKFVEAKLEGANDTQAAAAAGSVNASGFVHSSTIREQLAAARRWLTDTTQIKRLDVIEGVMDGIEMARTQGDAAQVIKGWTEVGKILGHYAPEVKKIELSMAQGRLRAKFEALSDEELLAIEEGRVIEGEATRVQ